jgi:hypothetical protein
VHDEEWKPGTLLLRGGKKERICGITSIPLYQRIIMEQGVLECRRRVERMVQK